MDDDYFRHGLPSWWVPTIVAIPAVGAVVIALQRWNTPYAAWAVPVALVVAVPWILGALGFPIPRLVWIGVTLAGTFVLVLYPVATDFAPFQLVVLAAVGASVLQPRWSLPVLVGCVAVVPAAEALGRYDGSAIWVLGITMGWLGGFSLHQQERANTARVERVAAEERSRIARELHDVVAHSLAVTMLNLTGARLALRRDPDEAEAALRQAEASGRQSMADIRRAVGLLGVGASSPMPGAGDIAELVREFGAAGLPITLAVDGDLHAVPPAVGLTLYRIVQESVANVVKHAPGEEAEVKIVVRGGSACVSVRNPCAAPRSPTGDGGYGIPGMRERAALIGGSLRAGPTDGVWCVAAELPVGVP